LIFCSRKNSFTQSTGNFNKHSVKYGYNLLHNSTFKLFWFKISSQIAWVWKKCVSVIWLTICKIFSKLSSISYKDVPKKNILSFILNIKIYNEQYWLVITTNIICLLCIQQFRLFHKYLNEFIKVVQNILFGPDGNNFVI